MNIASSFLILRDQATDYLIMLDTSQITACPSLSQSCGNSRLDVILHNGLTLHLPPVPAKQLIGHLAQAGILSTDESAAFLKQIDTPPPEHN